MTTSHWVDEPLLSFKDPGVSHFLVERAPIDALAIYQLVIAEGIAELAELLRAVFDRKMA